MRIAVVVVNYLSSELIAENIAPLSAELGCDVIIVDNYSKAHETAQVRRLAEQKGWHLEASPIDLGFGAGMNVGARIAMERGADALLLLNPDAKIDAANVMELADAAPPGSATIASPRILRPDGTIWFAGMTVSLSDGSMTPTRHAKDGLEWLTGACLWIPVTAWAQVGGFDEDYFLYWEDVDLSVRAERAGVALRVVSNATAFHDAGGSQQGFRGQREKSPLYKEDDNCFAHGVL